MKTCAILDLFSAHDHLIPSPIKYLNDLGYYVTVFTPSKNFRDVTKLLPNLKYDVVRIDPHKFKGIYYKHLYERYINKYKTISSLQNYDLLFINTFRTELPVMSVISQQYKNVLAIFHTPKTCILERRYSEFEKFGHQALVYSSEIGKKYNLPWLSPLTYADEEFINSIDNNTIIFCVPGTVRFTGRAYMALVRSVQMLIKSGERNFMVKILGRLHKKDGPKFIKEIKKANVEKYFSIMSGVSHEKFFHEVINSDFVLPIIDKYEEKIGEWHYFDMATSSIFLALGLNKIMICEKELSDAYQLCDAAITHSGGKLEDGMRIAMNTSTEERLQLQKKTEIIKKKMYSDSLENLRHVVSEL